MVLVKGVEALKSRRDTAAAATCIADGRIPHGISVSIVENLGNNSRRYALVL